MGAGGVLYVDTRRLRVLILGGFEHLRSSALMAATFSRRKLLWLRLAAAPVHGLMQNCHDWRQIDFRDLLNNMACIGQNCVLR